MMRDAKNFVALVSIVKPKVIICLGKLTYECVINALKLKKNFRVGNIADFCKLIDSRKNFTDVNGMRIFGMIHCGALGVNINRKKGVRTYNKSGIELMKDDWQAVQDYLTNNPDNPEK